MDEIKGLDEYLKDATYTYATEAQGYNDSKSDSYYIERDQEVRLRATKMWLEFLLAINKIYSMNGSPLFIPTPKEIGSYVELFGNYILNGEMEVNNE